MDGALIYLGYLGHPLRLRVKQLICSNSGSGHYCNLHPFFFAGISGQRVVHSRSACFFSEFPRGDLVVIIAFAASFCKSQVCRGLSHLCYIDLLLVYAKMVWRKNHMPFRYVQISNLEIFLVMVLDYNDYNICFNHHLVQMVSTMFHILVIRNGTMFHDNILTSLA